MKNPPNIIDKIGGLKSSMFQKDFLLLWEKSNDELKLILELAGLVRLMRDRNISPKVFDSDLWVSVFRDKSTRTRFSFASVCNLLGLEVLDMVKEKSQMAHGETVRETANMISFLTDIIGIRDNTYLAKGINTCAKLATLWMTISKMVCCLKGG